MRRTRPQPYWQRVVDRLSSTGGARLSLVMSPSPDRMSVKHTLVLQPELSEVHRARSFVAELAAGAGFGPERVFDIMVAVSEATANAIEHAYGAGEVSVEVNLPVDRLEVSVQGTGEFHLPAQSDGRAHRGLGLPLMATLADHLALYSVAEGGTLVTLTFYLPGATRDTSTRARSRR